MRRRVYQALIAHHVMLAGVETVRRAAADAHWRDLVDRAGDSDGGDGDDDDDDDDEDPYAGALACAAADACRSALASDVADRDAILASCALGAAARSPTGWPCWPATTPSRSGTCTG